MIEAGEVKSAAQIARDHDVTRARVCQIMALLRLAPEIMQYIDDLGGDEGCFHLSARKLRQIGWIEDHDEQRGRFGEQIGVTLAPSAPTSPRVAPGQAPVTVGGEVGEVGAWGDQAAT